MMMIIHRNSSLRESCCKQKSTGMRDDGDDANINNRFSNDA
jgi:hypothetical protein